MGGAPQGLYSELSKWRDKAVKRGRPCNFNSDIIPDWLAAEVKAAMETVGVEGAFRFLKQADLAERMRIERRLQRDLQAAFDELEPEFIGAIAAEEEPDFDAFSAAMQAIFIPFFVGQFTDEALDISAGVGIEFDPGLINQHALEWARSASFDLISGLTDTTRRTVQEAIAAFIETPTMTQGDLEKLLEPAFGKVRARMIGVTETTRANSAATNEIQALVNQTGVQMVRFWITQNDELVCPICGPLHNKPERVFSVEFPDGPPAHVNCRCDEGLRVRR